VATAVNVHTELVVLIKHSALIRGHGRIEELETEDVRQPVLPDFVDTAPPG
jgi:hypothetical protein